MLAPGRLRPYWSSCWGCSSPHAAAAAAAAAAEAVEAGPRPDKCRAPRSSTQLAERPAQGHGQVLPGQGHHRLGKALVKDFNAKYGSQGYKATLTEFPASADQQRTQFIQRQQAKSDDCDVFSSDVIWTAEFASQKWLYDLTPYIDKAKSKYIRRAAGDRPLRRHVLGRPRDQRRGFHLLPHRQGRRQAAGDLAAGLCGRQGAGRPRLSGRAV